MIEKIVEEKRQVEEKQKNKNHCNPQFAKVVKSSLKMMISMITII